MRETFVGFDSAWGDKKPGGIVQAAFTDGKLDRCAGPEPVRFNAAAKIVEKLRSDSDYMLIALDQPTLVPNRKGARPVECVAGALVSRLRGGVQPENCGKPVFGQDAPVWQFLDRIGARQEPLAARNARKGLYLIEVFPALALPALESDIMERRRTARYNPGKRKRFCLDDWKLVAKAVARDTEAFGLPQLSRWARSVAGCDAPRKRDQDLLDAAICLLVALRWRQCSRVAMIGDLKRGYMMTPVSVETHKILCRAAEERCVSYTRPPPRHSRGAGP